MPPDLRRVAKPVARRIRRSIVTVQRAVRSRSATAQDQRDPRMLFIVTYGRSGSTLLQGILNSIPGYVIRGENGLAVYDLFRFHRNMSERALAQGSGLRALQPRDAWFGIDQFSERASLDAMRRVVLDLVTCPPPGTRVSGFKEIRWVRPDLGEFVNFLQQLFPDARFIVNTRDLAATAASKWWKDRPDAATTLAAADAQIRGLLADLGDAGFHVHYDDYAADPTSLQQLFRWLGEPFDLAAVSDVLGIRHSY